MILKYNINHKIVFFFILWISIWLSIGINPQQIELFLIDFNKKDLSINSLIKFLRIFTPLFLSIFLLFNFIKNINHNKNFFNYNFSYKLIYILILLQLISLLISKNANINFYWIYQSTISLILIFLITKENYLYSKILINLSMIILAIVLLRYSIPFFVAFFSTPLSFYNMWPIIYDYDFSVPRPTGLARTSLIMIAFFIVFEFKKKKLSIINDLIIIFCSLNIVLLQSRTIFFLWPLIILIYLFYSKKNIKHKFRKFFLFLILPILLFFMLNYSKHIITNIKFFNPSNEKIYEIYKFILPGYDDVSNKDNDVSNKQKIQIFRDTDPKSFSSYRTLHWKIIFEDSKKNFLGHGPMGDRFVGETSASSLFFYALASSGYIGLIFVIVLSIRSAYLVVYFIFIKKIIYYKEDIYLIFSCLALIILFLRGILETSLGIFSIDYLIFIIAISICEMNYSKYKLKS
jgi:hypothetical protein